jgi:hypothetical protein
MSKVKAVAVAVVSMLSASVSYAQGNDAKLPSATPGYYVPPTLSPNNNGFSSNQYIPPSPARGPMYVACWADVPSDNTAYFSATFAGPAVNQVRKQFRTFVTTHYGPVSKVQCTGKFSKTVVTEQVDKWKDSARTTKNAVVDT